MIIHAIMVCSFPGCRKFRLSTRPRTPDNPHGILDHAHNSEMYLFEWYDCAHDEKKEYVLCREHVEALDQHQAAAMAHFVEVLTRE